ncbi:(Fe-S)-binding protein [Methanolobus halotolerans]|uniref:(Fe-S)-binding protein n=1 Tax=Methanolobus halotolerans TaxID=2052935 RepID=A0A4E0QSC1_9EURY|nr:(Fe-S)-binding protein [Methanolobus halotolerans]TGC09808.1 (Fe-S)-binding protein [Methanolobus halotolerans]
MHRFQKEISSCIDCKKCWDVCPANMVTEGNRFTPQGKIESLAKIIAGEELTQDEMDNIYLSTRCGACDDVCPVDIPITDIIQYERELLAQQGREPAKTTAISMNIIERNSPGSMDPSTRFDWVTDDLEIAENSDIAYMTGCWIAHSQPDIARSTIRLLNHAGIKPMLLKEEKCCGLFLIDNGHLEEAASHAKGFVDYIESLGVKKVIASCPGCYLVLGQDYPKLYRELNFEVEHSLNLFRDMIADGTLKPGKLDYTVSVRDACPLRKSKDVPRSILESMGVEVKELFDGKHVCCGGPAGFKPNFPEISSDVAMLSVQDYKKKADMMISYCPFCMHHIGGVCKSKDEELNMKDISVLLAESIFGDVKEAES